MIAVGLAAVFVVQLEADPGGHPLDRLGEGGVVHLLEEREHVAILATAEAVIPADLGTHVKTRAALVMERAEPLKRTNPCALERDKISDDVSDVDPRPNLVDIVSSNEAGHPPILVSASGVHPSVYPTCGVAGVRPATRPSTCAPSVCRPTGCAFTGCAFTGCAFTGCAFTEIQESGTAPSGKLWWREIGRAHV